MANKFFPLFVDLSEKRILVVGGGKIGTRRINTLLSFSDCITVVDPSPSESVKKLFETGRIRLLRESFREETISDADIVLSCTDNQEINQKIYQACKRLGIPVNIASDKSMCDFYFPGIAKNGNIVIGITASGMDHHQAKMVRQRIENVLNEEEK